MSLKKVPYPGESFFNMKYFRVIVCWRLILPENIRVNLSGKSIFFLLPYDDSR